MLMEKQGWHQYLSMPNKKSVDTPKYVATETRASKDGSRCPFSQKLIV